MMRRVGCIVRVESVAHLKKSAESRGGTPGTCLSWGGPVRGPTIRVWIGGGGLNGYEMEAPARFVGLDGAELAYCVFARAEAPGKRIVQGR